MLFINFLCLLYLMVLADSHTISKSIDNENKLDNNIFESIHDVDHPPINPKTRKDRQHKYKLYYNKDEDLVLPEALKEAKPYTVLGKTTSKSTRKTPTEHAKHHKSPKRRVGGFWRKLRGKDKKKETTKHDSFDRKRRISNHKKVQQNVSPSPGPRNKSRRKNKKKFSLRQPENKVTKREVSGLFSTRPYSNTPQSYKLQMGIAPQVDNMLKSKHKLKVVQPFSAVNARVGVTNNLQEQLASITSTVTDLKERYGGNPLEAKPFNTGSPSADDVEINNHHTTVGTTEPEFQGTAQIDLILNDKKAKAIHLVPFQKPLVTNLGSNSVTEATFNAYPVLTRFGIPDPGSGLSTFVSINDNENLERTTVASTKSDEFNPNESIFSANTEAHYLAARSIKEDTMTIAQNVEDMLQRELKNIYNKVKHKVSSDLHKEVHTVKSTAKDGYRKLSTKLSSTCKNAANATSSRKPATITNPPKPKTCPCKSSTKQKEQSWTTTTTSTTTTPPRVKKKDDTEDEKFIEDTYTPETVYKQTYDDYMMLTLFEQILSKTHEENVRKMLATTEYPTFAKNKRETFRLSKRNPETLTDVKLREVIQNLYDDGGNMPDYDYIDPSSNVSSTDRVTANNNYNDPDYLLDPSLTTDNSADGFMVEVNDKNKGATPTPADPEHADHGDHSTADSHISASDNSFEGLSNKISYNEFVNGYKHYLKFQKDQNNQNFSNLVKYQAHRHHSVDDIGKYILNKIPPLPSSNKKKREQTFSDDSENNMDYQEITTKNDDSWFRKHFYVFIDNGPPKKYHTSETVELKPPSTKPKLYMMTEPTPGIVPNDHLFVRIGLNGLARKAKHTQEISLDDLAKTLDSMKDKQISDTSSRVKEYVQKDTFNPIDIYNGTDDATSRDKSIISKFFSGKRRHEPKKDIETTEYFPDYMFADSTQRGRLRRSITKESLENTMMADFINKDIEEKASTGSKEVLVNSFSNRETNKFGYVNIDLVPRQTAVVKLRDNAKKSRIKNFFKKFKFKKKKAINPKPKRSCRRERFNPIKKLKSIFKYKEEKDKEKEDFTPDRLMNPDYDMVNSHMSNYKPIKFSHPLSVADMQKQIPNISDIYFEPEPKQSTTLSSHYFHLDDKDQDLLYNYNPATSADRSKAPVTNPSKPVHDASVGAVAELTTDSKTGLLSDAHNGQENKAFADPYSQPAQQRKVAKLVLMEIGRTNATKASPEPSSSSTAVISKSLLVSTIKKPEIQRIPPCNLMTVNVKTLPPSTTALMTTEVTRMTIDDMGLVLDNMQNKLKKDPENFPKVTTASNPSYVRQTDKYEYKKDVEPLSPPKGQLEELLLKSKLTRIVKFPIRTRRYKKKKPDDSEIVDIGKDNLSLGGPSVLEYINDLGNMNTFPERRKTYKGNTMRKIHHSHLGKAGEKDKSRYTDYFNDLIMWHNDILNLDTVPNASWVLKTVQPDTGTIYTTPKMNNLLIGLKEMNDYLDPSDNVNRSVIWKDRVGLRHFENQLDDQGIIQSVAMDDNTIVTSKDMLIKGEAKYYQYNKPKNVATKLSSNDFIMKLDRLNFNNDNKSKEKILFKRKGGRRLSPPLNDSKQAIIVDTTLLAYDDDVDSVTKTLEMKKQSRNSQMSLRVIPKSKMEHSPFLKTNKRPMQYYTTPLPMNSRDFNKFLKEHEMDVDFVTSPIRDLPTIRTTNPTLKKIKEPKPTTITTTKSTFAALNQLSNWKTPTATSLPQLPNISGLVSNKKVKSTTTKKKGLTHQLESKLSSFTKALGKSVKFTSDHPKVKDKLKKTANSTVTNNKDRYWDNEFDRYKRLSELKLPTKATLAKHNKATTQEANYYSIFKKKMKNRLFEKKATGSLNSPTTEPFTAQTRDKDVEITIINFEDIEKLTSQQPYDITLPTFTRDEIGAIANYGAATVTPDTTIISTDFSQNEKEIHNGLLYKDVFKERTLSTASTTEYSTTDFIKSTEYVDPIVNDGQAIISTKGDNNKKLMLNRYSLDKMPMYPSILKKMPHVKNFNSVPKRVHISSHHYKYDVFYDDFKRMGKTNAGEGLPTKHAASASARPHGVRPINNKRASTSEKGTGTEVVKNIDETSHRNRQKRKIWGREAAHKKRKNYTFRECKSKSDGGGLTQSTGSFTLPIILTPLAVTNDVDVSGTRDEETNTLAVINTALVSDKPHEEPFTSAGVNTALVSEELHEEPFTSAVDETSEVFLTRRYTEPITDIEDVVTMLDGPEIGVTESDIEDAVTLSAMRSEYFTIVTIRESVRRALFTPSTTVTLMPATAKPATKLATKPATKPVTKHVTKLAKMSGPKPSPQPYSLVYNLKPSKDKKKKPLSGPDKDRHRRLFKISALLQNRIKNLMKNLTASTKLTNATTRANATTQKLKPKRTCVTFPDSPSTSDDSTKQAVTKTLVLVNSADTEGFRVSCKPNFRAEGMPTQDEFEDVTPASFCHHKCKSNHKICDCHLYVEPETYSDQQYYELGPMKCKCPTTTTSEAPTPCCGREQCALHCDFKREAQTNTFTAKDVAALEVIVDLMKNTLSDEDNNLAGLFRHSNIIMPPYSTKPVKANASDSTNSIQVHIAIPYDFQNGKKRSPPAPGPVRVRKVFSAKMSTPVDLEYQVNSFEGTIAPTSTKPSNVINATDSALSPGMYLLIDKPKDGFALKPVLGQINLSNLKARHAVAGTTVSMTESKPIDTREETTSLKNLAKVTLSKDFVAAINQQLIEMYENITRVNKDVHKNVKNQNITRPARSVWKSRKLKEKKEGRNKIAEKYIVKRRIDWDAVKQFFGHDRVCNCKCKSNKTMCRACAASDAVIDELIFEFDNIGRYMADHCTEIQTYFWMNPVGGQRLRESVNKIDKSLSDYYKRVKGKCQGRLCKCFSNYIDKRQFIKISKTKKEGTMSRLVSDLAVLAEDLNRTISLKVCYNDKLKQNGDKFLHFMNNCIVTKPMNKNKRSIPNTTPKKLIKNVYSLDNINVNIICNPETSTTTDVHMLSATITSQENARLTDQIIDFDLEETKHKKRKGFKKLFPRKSKKSKLLSYFEFNKRSKTNCKRQVDNQAATPLISDGGGAFWYDYLKTGTNEPRLARDSIKDTPGISINVVQKGATEADLIETASNNDLGTNTVYMTGATPPERNQRDMETTTDSLSRNINQMLQLFGSLQDVEAINKNSSQTAMVLPTKTRMHKAVSQDKPKKQSLTIVKNVQQKMDRVKSKGKSPTFTVPQPATKKINPVLDKKLEELTTIKQTIDQVTHKSTLQNTNATKDSSDDGLLISKMAINATTFKMTTAMSPVTDKTSATTYFVEKNNTRLSTTTAPKSDGKSESPQIFDNESTTKLGFMKKLKAATLLMFNKEHTSPTPKLTTEAPTQATTALSTEIPLFTSGIIDIVTDGNKKNMDYVIEESPVITTQNPTILIINDYGNQISSEALDDGSREGYRNLLLSIIQFETNSLNEEWDRVAYGADKNRVETDVKRSIVSPSKDESVKPTTTLTFKTKPPAEVTYEEGSSEQDVSTKEPKGLLNKIVSKMGIKVVNNKKKVVKKASIRDVKKEKKKGNFIKNRKLRINSYRQGYPTSPGSMEEACHTRRTTKPSQICDIQATYDHIRNIQKSLPAKTFEALVRNITCYKYKNADSIFTIPYKKQGKRWDWIRKRRSLKVHFYNKLKVKHDLHDDAFVVNFGDDSQESYEKFVKGDDGIYKIVKRKKRTANLGALERGLRNIPALVPGKDEVFVMLGDSVTLDCGIHAPVLTCDGKFKWKTDRKRMMNQDNVNVDGVRITIHNVEARNVGTYTCSLDHTVRRSLRLNVLTVPSFDVVFLPVYKTLENCTYDDLKAIQRLGGLMANETQCGKACSIRIDEPVCQRDKGTNSTLIRATAVISMTPRELNCSLQCKRDLVSSLVMLCASNTAILSSITVLVSKDGVNETLVPWKNLVRPIVTHTLRKKDTNGHHEYHKLVPLLSPGKVNVVLICPAGYYLLPRYKLCSSCPPNTSSKAGDNTCRSCPRGTRAEPGAAKCHIVNSLPRRYDWWWYPPCGYVVACCGVLCGCSACVLLSVIVHVVSRDTDLKENEDGDDEEHKILKALPGVTLAYTHVPSARPLSPSRVILPRFFRPSLTSSRATDSQETKFELWKERNRPPPLPPIDFDR